MDKLYDYYFALPSDSSLGIFSKVFNRIVARIVKKRLDRGGVDCFKTKETLQRKHNLPIGTKLIASLTSFPGRINEVWISIETILRQSVPPDKVILWLSKDQFHNQLLPVSLTNLFNRGVEVRWCDGDLRSHKKYFYALQEYKKDVVILFDDDLYYPSGIIENLLKMYNDNPYSICATRVHRMTFQGFRLRPYRQWLHNYNPTDYKVPDLFFTSGAGTLIPPEIMPNTIFNETIIKKICLMADDVWLNMNAKKAHINIVSNSKYNKDEISIGLTQREKLVSKNVTMGGNDSQIKDVIEYLQLNLL